MDVEAVRLVLNDSSTGIVTLTVPELCHVLFMDSIPVCGEIVYLDEDVALRLIHQTENARVEA